MGEGCNERQLEHEKRITALEASAKSAHYRLDELQRNQKILSEMNANIKVLAEQNKTQNSKIDKIEKDVSGLKDKPGQYWEKGVITAVAVVVSGVVGAGLALILK